MREVFIFVLGLSLSLAGGGSVAAQRARPNILLILADDVGIDDISSYGSDRFQGKTPNIDRLAESGIQFMRCFAAPVCGPTRCELMTGLYPFRTGAVSNSTASQPSPASEPSLARRLQRAGYATGMAGKWRQMGDTPADWGFEEYLTDPDATGYYWRTSYIENGRVVTQPQQFYFPEVCYEFAVGFMQRHQNEPFFFYYPTHLPHAPIVRTPDSPKGATNQGRLYNDNIAYLDKQVGQLVAALEELGLREQTLVVFSADNGTAINTGHGLRSGTIGGREVLGAKGSMLEGGARVPLIASWPGITPAGMVLAGLVDFSDFFPTFAELAGMPLPAGGQLDGRSFVPQLFGEQGRPRQWVFVQNGRNWYVRSDSWKLNQDGQLFNMADAPFAEELVPASTPNAAARAARSQLQSVLEQLNPR